LIFTPLLHSESIGLAAATARLLGGGVWVQIIAALCVLTGCIFLGIGTTLSTGEGAIVRFRSFSRLDMRTVAGL